ncbi:hypothetical protein GCM10009564_06160 [Streptomyces thermogriseus]|uniref:Uncharacterized protein n=1 Tax=Streptomyces thermogriseus TaxID=75292 RepID=A0ABP4D9Y4_9ACTN
MVITSSVGGRPAASAGDGRCGGTGEKQPGHGVRETGTGGSGGGLQGGGRGVGHLGVPLRGLGRGNQEGPHQKSRTQGETYWTHRDTSAYQETPGGPAVHSLRPRAAPNG